MMIKVRVFFHNSNSTGSMNFTFKPGCFDINVHEGYFNIVDHDPIDKNIARGIVMVGSLTNCTIVTVKMDADALD